MKCTCRVTVNIYLQRDIPGIIKYYDLQLMKYNKGNKAEAIESVIYVNRYIDS